MQLVGIQTDPRPELTWLAGCLYKGRLMVPFLAPHCRGIRLLACAASVWRKGPPRRLGHKVLSLAAAPFYGIIWTRWERRGEADLSTKQNCAKAPARVSCPDGDRGRSQGYRGAARARPQTAVRVKSSDDRF
jgi:hypothetical protein